MINPYESHALSITEMGLTENENIDWIRSQSFSVSGRLNDDLLQPMVHVPFLGLLPSVRLQLASLPMLLLHHPLTGTVHPCYVDIRCGKFQLQMTQELVCISLFRAANGLLIKIAGISIPIPMELMKGDDFRWQWKQMGKYAKPVSMPKWTTTPAAVKAYREPLSEVIRYSHSTWHPNRVALGCAMCLLLIGLGLVSLSGMQDNTYWDFLSSANLAFVLNNKLLIGNTGRLFLWIACLWMFVSLSYACIARMSRIIRLIPSRRLAGWFDDQGVGIERKGLRLIFPWEMVSEYRISSFGVSFRIKSAKSRSCGDFFFPRSCFANDSDWKASVEIMLRRAIEHDY